MKAFTVFWKDATPPSAIVVARDFDDCKRIADTYGEVTAIHTEKGIVISEPKPEETFLVSA